MKSLEISEQEVHTLECFIVVFFGLFLIEFCVFYTLGFKFATTKTYILLYFTVNHHQANPTNNTLQLLSC